MVAFSLSERDEKRPSAHVLRRMRRREAVGAVAEQTTERLPCGATAALHAL